jgi:hypothetical protein
VVAGGGPQGSFQRIDPAVAVAIVDQGKAVDVVRLIGELVGRQQQLHVGQVTAVVGYADAAPETPTLTTFVPISVSVTRNP